MNGTADNTYYTTLAWRKKQSQLRMAVNPGVLCTLNASNELSQHGVHDKQTATLLPHYITHTFLHVCKEHLSLQTSKPSAISVGAHTSKQNTHTIFTSLSFPLYSVHEPCLLHFSCIQQASQIYTTYLMLTKLFFYTSPAYSEPAKSTLHI